MKENPFTNPKVREAINIAIDRETIVDIVLEGLGTPASQLMPEGFFGYNESLKVPEYDDAKAKELLTEAGYPNGFTMGLYCTADRLPGDGATCEGIGQMLTSIGIKTNVNAITKTVFFPAQARGDYSASMNGWGTLTGEAAYTLNAMVHSKDDEKGFGAYNRVHYKNPELDKKIEDASVELDDTKRRAMFEDAMALARNSNVVIPIVQLQAVWAAKKGKFDFTPRVDQDTLAMDIHPAE